MARLVRWRTDSRSRRAWPTWAVPPNESPGSGTVRWWTGRPSRARRCATGTAWKSSDSSAVERTHGMNDDRLTIAGIEFRSRLWVGTGKYKDFVETQKVIEASGADVVTVAVRRVNITDRKSENLLDYLSA